MKVFFTGATGVIGSAAIPALVAAGHDVAGVARTEAGHAWLDEAGARPVEVDLFDPAAVRNATVGAEAIVHMATAIPSQKAMPKRESWAVNDRLRTETTRFLIDAARANGVEGFVQQSITFVYADGGDAWLDEDSPIGTVWDVLDSALDAESETARFTAEGGHGIVLRLSSLYGPGRASAEYIESVAAHKLPIIGRGDNFASHLHVADTATAIVAALDAPAGVYNVTDDEPVTKRQELESLAATIGAKAPRSLPPWLAKIAVGPAAALLSVSQRVSNARFKAETGWQPRFGTITTGWADAATAKVER